MGPLRARLTRVRVTNCRGLSLRTNELSEFSDLTMLKLLIQTTKKHLAGGLFVLVLAARF